MSGFLILTGFSPCLGRTTLLYCRHASTRSRATDVLPALHCPAITKWPDKTNGNLLSPLPCPDMNPSAHLCSYLLWVYRHWKTPAWDPRLSRKQNVQMFRRAWSTVPISSTHTGSAYFCDFLSWLRLQLPSFPFKYQIVCFSFTLLYITLCMHVSWSFATFVLFFFFFFSVSRLVIYISNDTTERTCYTCYVKPRDLLFTNEIAHRKQN